MKYRIFSGYVKLECLLKNWELIEIEYNGKEQLKPNIILQLSISSNLSNVSILSI